MLRWLLRKIGYYHIDYGVACGRRWMSIDGKIIAQTPGDDCWLRDEDIHRIVYVTVDHGKHWSKPGCDCWRYKNECQHPGYRFCEKQDSADFQRAQPK